MKHQSWFKVIGIGVLIGLVAALFMTVVISVLRYLLGLASPPELVGDRIAPFFEPYKFFALLDSFGGYNELKKAGVRGVLGGQLAVGALGGALYAVIVERARRRSLSGATAPGEKAATRPANSLT